jgi:hypothetical protein
MSWIYTPESSIVAGFEYVACDRALIVEFNHGGRFRFEGVPEDVFERMRASPSKAQFVAQNVKDVFRETRV